MKVNKDVWRALAFIAMWRPMPRTQWLDYFDSYGEVYYKHIQSA